jgi:hypothetical protein
MLLTKFHIIWPSGFRGKAVLEIKTIRNKNCLWWPYLLTDQNGMSNSHREPSIDASYQVSVYLAKLCQRRRFLEIDQSEKELSVVAIFVNRLGQNKKTFHRYFLPSFGSFGHAVSEEKIFRNRPIRNKNRLWRPCLLMELEQNKYYL